MRLTTSGIPNEFLRESLVGIVSREHRPPGERQDRVLLVDEIPTPNGELSGYTAVLSGDKGNLQNEIPAIFSLRETEHLRTGDIIALEPKNGFVRTLYRPDSDYNVIFATHRCNSNCLMCSQPPQDRDDIEASFIRNRKLVGLIEKPPTRLTITGGEPTLMGDRLFDIIRNLRDRFPHTYVHMLTNGRIFAWSAFTSRLADIKHPDFVLGVPLYSDDPSVHDHVVQARNAFDQTVLGLQQLAHFGLRVEIRVVLHALTVPRLPQLAEYIYRNLTFAEHIALMGLENIGYASRNMEQLWIDPFDYQNEIEEAIEILSTRGMNVSIYNHQLCVLRPTLWKFARKSISDWKNIYLEKCEFCGVRSRCGGFFQWATKLHSSHIEPTVDKTLLH